MLIPLFPLDAVLFPTLQMPLHVFEERYREMIGRCISDGNPFGVARAVSGLVVGGNAECAAVGTIAEVDKHRRLPDGRLLIVVRGSERFRIESRSDDKPYPEAEVVFIESDHGFDVDESAVAEIRRLAQRWVALAAEADEIDDYGILELDENAETASYQVSGGVVRDLDVRQELLELDTSTRVTRLVEYVGAENARLESAIMQR